jgi:hypothetical protein
LECIRNFYNRLIIFSCVNNFVFKGHMAHEQKALSGNAS